MVLLSAVRRAIMRAVRVNNFGGPEVMKVEESLPLPEHSSTQVLIKVEAAGVNPVDTYIRSGAYARLPPLPYTPGSDSAGVVEAVGKSVTKFKKGDRVYTVRSVTGAYAGYTVAESVHVGPLSDKLDFLQGAALGVPYFTAHRAVVTQAKVTAEDTVLVHGASGAVGLASVQIAKSLGAKVIGTAGTPAGMTLVTNNGADHVVCHREDKYTEKIMEMTGGEGPSVIIEMLSNVNLPKDLEMIKLHGRVALIGCRGTVEINPRLIMAKESQVMGVMVMGITQEEWEGVHQFLKRGADSGWLKPVICKEYSLDQAPTAHNDVINNTGALGKLVLKI